ncbi:MAG: Mur ligase family protein, partial [Bacteroidota bacterium]
MKPYSFHTIASYVSGRIIQDPAADIGIINLCTDSRKILYPESSLFFALKTERADGHTFIKSCYDKGVRHFIVSENIDVNNYPEAGFVLVDNTLNALQQLAAHHRTANQQPSTDNLQQTTPNRQPTTIIGITGSNGKTIVKEWLYQLLQEDENIVRSPKSYNSQIGVPLSVWELEPEHTLGIFEAGISQKGEMGKLASIIQPTIGVFTFLGDAHKEGFENDQEKVKEKCKLFATADTIIYPSAALGKYIQKTTNKNFITWGKDDDDDLKVLKETIEQHQTIVQVQWENKIIHLTIPFTDKASIYNA